MCATFQFCGRTFRPGDTLHGSGPHGALDAVWTGFARQEILAWWTKKGASPVDLPADRFAERSEIDGRLVWGPVPDGQVICGLWESDSRRIRILTRAAEPPERQHFGHPRMPVLTPARYERIALPPDPQGELFSG